MTLPLIIAVLLLLFMTGVWGVYMVYRQPAIIDIAWASSIGIGSICLFLISPDITAIKWAALACILLWSGKLTYLLSWRMFQGMPDRRYDALSSQFGKWKDVKYLLFYYAQGIGAFVMLIPMMYIFIDEGVSWNWIATIAVIWFAVSFLFEGWADYTLALFKKKNKGANEICEEGLWRYSRHPNYFFEVQIWVAIALFAGASSQEGFVAFITPAVLLVLVLFVTGVPVTEMRAVEKYGEKYKKYQKRTSTFIPWFPN